MPDQDLPQASSKERILATIANKKDPTQLVEIVHLPDKQLFVTRGISHNFHIKEIAIPQGHMLAEIHVVTKLLSYLLERIADAADFNLLFRYSNDFEFDNRRYHFQEIDDYLLLLAVD
ncbi:MAG: hypothetical protein JRJ12_03005 [Deltaproteobacteria bacterium]|nr:hypothetical protein [Deltaproteobacteria bacterium]MBW2070112.1 hypothetical protein [Deltaproteobacteria bacterium]